MCAASSSELERRWCLGLVGSLLALNGDGDPSERDVGEEDGDADSCAATSSLGKTSRISCVGDEGIAMGAVPLEEEAEASRWRAGR